MNVDRDQKVEIHADAPIEAPTVRGFVAIMIEGLSGAKAQDILAVGDEVIERLGLLDLLGMLRMRGVHGILRRIKTEVARGLMANDRAQTASSATGIS